MAKRKLVSQERTRNIIGKIGQHGIRLDIVKEEYDDGDGAEIQRTTAEHTECGDGTVINTAMLLQNGKDRWVLRLCDSCDAENRKTGIPANPYSPADHVLSCARCRKNICTRHQKQFEEQVVCKSCQRKLFWLNLLFFRKVEP